MQKKVYISSTFRDLKDHRERVIDLLQKFPDKFDLVAMENYVAEALPPVDKCVQDVLGCDIYILLLANRYGFIPQGSDKSVTEIEYQTAKEHHKEILVFISDDVKDFPPDTDGDVELKKQKLAAFKQAVRAAYLTHPEPFISPDNLAVQVSESLMKKLFLDYQIIDKRKLCCDRRLQFSEYLKFRTKSQVKAFLIHGQRKELGRNMINRFLFFTLNTGIEGTLPYHLTTDFILGDYESSKTSLIVNILETDLQLSDIKDTGFDYLIAKIDERPYPNIVIVLECSTSFLRPDDIDILKKFFCEFHTTYEKTGKKEVYFFLNIEDNNEDENVIKDTINSFLQCNEPGNEFLFCLPRLKRENYRVIEQWISTYVTGDNNCVNLLMEKYFSNLMDSGYITMSDAELSLQKLMKKINTRDEEVLEILNF
ncbi:MAG: DUF4062 domain-containing protein [Bacteroidota bacterium]|nr:DUF4062 domain-containing protein [Flavisolibacter sp.]MDQ3843009.1 DUF4062 domain-containing protein [Bacteroidota bacterium]